MSSYILAGIMAVLVVVGSVWYFNQKTEPHQPVIQSHRSFTLQSAGDTTYQPNKPATYTFSIVDDQGTTIKDFAVTHEKLMHLIVVRKDLAEFQHLHPDFDQATGQFTQSNLVFPSDGQYRVFADFAPLSAQRGMDGMPLGVTLSEDVSVGAAVQYKPQPLGSAETTKTFGEYQVALTTHGELTAGSESMLMFTLTRAGQLVTNLEPYLGALGHSVILREGTLDFIHVHPMDTPRQNGMVSFMVHFPEAGRYKVFTQFQHEGKVFTTDFVVSVAPGTEEHSMNDMMMRDMGHTHTTH